MEIALLYLLGIQSFFDEFNAISFTKLARIRACELFLVSTLLRWRTWNVWASQSYETIHVEVWMNGLKFCGIHI
jgi:hypothetical protein